MNLQALETVVRDSLNGADCGGKITEIARAGSISPAEQRAVNALSLRIIENPQSGRANLYDNPDPVPNLTWI